MRLLLPYEGNNLKLWTYLLHNILKIKPLSLIILLTTLSY